MPPDETAEIPPRGHRGSSSDRDAARPIARPLDSSTLPLPDLATAGAALNPDEGTDDDSRTSAVGATDF